LCFVSKNLIRFWYCVLSLSRAPFFMSLQGVDRTKQQWDAMLYKAVLFYPITINFVLYKIIYKPINYMHNLCCINYYLILKATHYKGIRFQVWLHVDLLNWFVVDQSKSGTSNCTVILRRCRKIAKRGYYIYARPLVRMENLGSHCKYFYIILYLIILPKSVEKI
jgi:hypothetical protein